MTAAVYDNPATMRREAWQDGRLVCDVSAAQLETRGWEGHRRFPFMLNVGYWSAGQLIGDRAALSAADNTREAQ